MSENTPRFLPILGQGEKLIEPVKPKSGRGETNYPRTYVQAREYVKQKISTLRNSINEIPAEKRLDEVIITVRLNSKFLAKSYTPNTLFKMINVENVGSRRWLYSDNLLAVEHDQDSDIVVTEDEEQTASTTINYSKLHFIRATSENILRLEQMLNTNELSLKDAFKKDIQKIEDISLLSPTETVVGFEEDWESGKVEMVLHPFEEDDHIAIEKITNLLLKHNVSENSLRIKNYTNGPTFISANLNKEALQALNNFNPLRTVHPIRINSVPEMRIINIRSNAPNPSHNDVKSSIKVGMFDGGTDLSVPLLKNHVHENIAVNTAVSNEGIVHGTAVAGCILYGKLNAYGQGTHVPQPLVSVESFKVLPLTDPDDYELYEAIDTIEDVVPSRHDINVYNLSFGPIGPILDHDISRFTYALDALAWNHGKLFVVAVGNDGELEAPFNRIQAPADMVNGLGVGAYTYDPSTGQAKRASYSCIGQGREGCKVKPDIAGFGGDDNNPIHLVSVNHNQKLLSMGTSFAAPIISGMAGEILGRCDRFNPLIARALLIHSAKNPNYVCNELGFGLIDQTVEEIINCTDKSVTLVYSSTILPASFAKLPIPLPLNSQKKGMVEVKYTIAVLSKANPLHVEDYTESAIEDTFYPHDKKYRFSIRKQGRPKSVTKHIHKDASEISNLIAQGYVQSVLPVSKSMTSYKTELARRGELKWDTVVHRWNTMQSSTLENPFLVLHGMSRNSSMDRMDYAVIVTISAPQYSGSLYEDILNAYKQLQPIQLRTTNEILVPVQ